MEPTSLQQIIEVSGAQWMGPRPVPERVVRELSTDSRVIGSLSLFVALRGERQDGHEFIRDARRKGAVASVVEAARAASLPRDEGPYLVMEDPLELLERVAAWNRRRPGLKVIAVTGSVGKTSTKEFIATVLSRSMRVRSAPKSYNNRLGVSLTLLQADASTEVVVAELGTSAPGEIAHLTRLAAPDGVVITEIAPAHLDGLGDIDGVIRAKAEIFEGQAEGGPTFLKHGVAGEARFREQARGPVSTFGFGAGDLSVTDCQRVTLGHDPKCGSGCTEYGYHFTLGGEQNFLLPVPGRHNVLNAVAAIGVARALGIDWDAVREGLTQCRLPALRLQVTEENGVVFVDDSYNANPVSMTAAIDEWRSFASGPPGAACANGSGSGEQPPGARRRERGNPRVAILGDMLEMGEGSRALHEQVGAAIAGSSPRILVTVGSESRWIADACAARGPQVETAHFPSASEAYDFLRARITHGDCVLVKGSRRVGLDALVRDLKTWFRSRPALS